MTALKASVEAAKKGQKSRPAVEPEDEVTPRRRKKAAAG
jgi:hypothetical protein